MTDVPAAPPTLTGPAPPELERATAATEPDDPEAVLRANTLTGPFWSRIEAVYQLWESRHRR